MTLERCPPSAWNRVRHGVEYADLARHAIVLNPPNAVAALIAPDVGDQFLWDVLSARPDLVLVTGDKLLLQDPLMRQRIVSPQAFVAQWQH